MGDKRREEQDRGTEDRGIKVTDRRLFTEDGTLRRDVVESEEEDTIEQAGSPETTASDGAARNDSDATREQAGFEHRSLEEPEGVDFTMLINAMAQPALIFLGEVSHPGTGRPEINLEQARVQIDLLDVLRIKCRGNLTAEEEGLLDRILYQLRMLYVTRSNQPSS
jgi:hypothetical protein